MFMNFNPCIASTDFDEMRAQYKDYLRAKCYNDTCIINFISIFDNERYAEHYEWIYKIMKEIGVTII